MIRAWFFVLAGTLAAYAALDGYDIGVGTVSLFVAHRGDHRRRLLQAIGPVWNGNEVWLVAAGGLLFVSFPRVYAIGFSGFYLPFVLLLWLLILRGVSIESRGQVDHPLWRSFWDVCFFLSSLLLALVLGVALGNGIRGMPIGSSGQFQGTFTLLLNPYAPLVSGLSLATLAWHGMNYLRVKTEDVLLERARRWSPRLGVAAGTLTLLTIAATVDLPRPVGENFRSFPPALLLPAAGLAGIVMALTGAGERGDRRAFLGSTLAIVSIVATAAVAAFPVLLRSTVNQAWSLTVYNSSASPHGLETSLVANGLGLVAVAFSVSYVHRVFRGRLRIDRTHGY